MAIREYVGRIRRATNAGTSDKKKGGCLTQGRQRIDPFLLVNSGHLLSTKSKP